MLVWTFDTARMKSFTANQVKAKRKNTLFDLWSFTIVFNVCHEWFTFCYQPNTFRLAFFSSRFTFSHHIGVLNFKSSHSNGSFTVHQLINKHKNYLFQFYTRWLKHSTRLFFFFLWLPFLFRLKTVLLEIKLETLQTIQIIYENLTNLYFRTIKSFVATYQELFAVVNDSFQIIVLHLSSVLILIKKIPTHSNFFPVEIYPKWELHKTRNEVFKPKLFCHFPFFVKTLVLS